MKQCISSTILVVLLGFVVLTKTEKTAIGAPILCNETVTDPKCGPCLTATGRIPSIDQEKFFDYMDSGHVMVNGSDIDGLYTWTFNEEIIENPQNITVSLNMWDVESGRIGQPVAGCCEVPLTSQSCNIKECIKGIVYVSITYKHLRVIGPKRIPTSHRCGSKRVSARYFNICVHEPTDWARQFNCECVIYDSVTGEMRPGNHSSDIMENVTDIGVWQDTKWPDPAPYEVCQFDMKKETVLKRGRLINNSLAMEPSLFKRGVYNMDGLKWSDGLVMDINLGATINCTRMKFEGTEVFNLSSPLPNNDTFTCLVLWPNGTTEYAPLGTHVKCMPLNTTFGKQSHLYVMNEVDPFMSVMFVFIPACGSVILLILVTLLAYHWRKKVQRFVNETKSVPEELDSVMQDKPVVDSSNELPSEKENAHAYDKEEKERVSLRKIQEIQLKQQTEGDAADTDTNLLPKTHLISSRNPEVMISNGYRTKDFQHVICSDDTVMPHGFSHGSSSHVGIDDSNPGFNSISNMSGVTAVSSPNDSGCPKLIENSDNFEFHVTATDDDFHGKSNFVENISFSSSREAEVFVKLSNQDNDKKSPSRGVPENNGGYWAKECFCDPPPLNRLSQTSNDTGCGTDSDPDCDDPEIREVSNDVGKHPFLKTTSKDSGVSTENLYLRSMEEDSDEDLADATSHPSLKTFIVKNPSVIERVYNTV